MELTIEASPWAPCDFDKDGDVDLEDFGRFQVCCTRPGIPQNEEACRGAKLEGDDEDVDGGDLDKFLVCMSGPSVPANPDCAD